MCEIIFLNELLGNVQEFYAYILRSIHWGLEIKVFCVKEEKTQIATRQDIVNYAIDEAEGTYGHAYIAEITEAAANNSDVCTIGILLLRSEFTHNHGVANSLSSITRYIFKSNDAESVCALNALVLGAL